MARVRLRVGECELEIDSRDFYVDNESISGIVEELAKRLPSADNGSGRYDGRDSAYSVDDAVPALSGHAVQDAAACEMPSAPSGCSDMYCEAPVPVLARPTAPEQAQLDGLGLGGMRDAEAFEPEFADDGCNRTGSDISRRAPDDCSDPTATAAAGVTGNDVSLTDGHARVHSRLQVRDGLLALRDAYGFFDVPRTARDAAAKLRENGWNTSSLAVSKILADMAHCRQMAKNLRDGGTCTYASPEAMCRIMDYDDDDAPADKSGRADASGALVAAAV